MTVLVDTSVLIDHLAGNTDARQALRTAADSGRRVAASVVTKVEVLAGMRPAEEPKTRRLLDVTDWIDVDEEIAEQAGALANQYLRSHPGVDAIDYIIAATAQALDADLWTTSFKHFPMFPQPVSPY
ncbi:MAG: type II toxin-antitoxin system VapC family toxin [Actinomycetota bacterium]|nr:type II toxin-antitoxin system VapC family toxin [Actinomycetota bacterium]